MKNQAFLKFINQFLNIYCICYFLDHLPKVLSWSDLSHITLQDQFAPLCHAKERPFMEYVSKEICREVKCLLHCRTMLVCNPRATNFIRFFMKVKMTNTLPCFNSEIIIIQENTLIQYKLIQNLRMTIRQYLVQSSVTHTVLTNYDLTLAW